MKSKPYSKIGVLLIVTILAGCISQTPNLDANWGKSSTTTKFSQMENPDASEDMTAHKSIGGAQSENISNKYNESFTVKQKRPVYNINMPGVTSK